jgi:hypothetical protein
MGCGTPDLIERRCVSRAVGAGVLDETDKPFCFAIRCYDVLLGLDALAEVSAECGAVDRCADTQDLVVAAQDGSSNDLFSAAACGRLRGAPGARGERGLLTGERSNVDPIFAGQSKSLCSKASRGYRRSS